MEQKLLQLSTQFGFNDALLVNADGDTVLLLFSAYSLCISPTHSSLVAISPYYPASQRGYLAANEIMQPLKALGLSPCIYSEKKLKHIAASTIGSVGKNTLFYHPKFGSLLNMQAIKLDISPPPIAHKIHSHCGTCTMCIDACPTGALSTSGFVRENCVREQMGRASINPKYGKHIKRLMGCDICQSVCPKNSTTLVEAKSYDIISVLDDKHTNEIKKLVGANFGTRTRILNQTLFFAANTLYTPALPAIERLLDDEQCKATARYAYETIKKID